MLLLGIDIGTSSAKGLLCDERGAVVATASESYPLSQPREGWSEQNPADWWAATRRLVPRLAGLAGRPASDIAAVGLSGQMHGSVLLDQTALVSGGTAGDALRPALLWNDQRTAEQCKRFENAAGGRRRLVELCGNAALPGFTLPKLLWVREHEPEVWRRTAAFMMPKDFVRWRLTGEAATDVGDASGTLLFDVSSRKWSPELCAIAGIDAAVLPRVLESGEVAGRVTRWASEQMGGKGGGGGGGLREGTPVVAGSGDNMMGAIGAGIVREGVLLATLGTSGVIYAHTDMPRPDLRSPPAPSGRTHAMCAATGTASLHRGFCATGCMLSAAGALQWARDTIAPGVEFDGLMAEASSAPIGCDGLIFLPHLTGERCPHPDPAARGAWVGLTSRHTRAHLIRAVLEGVTLTMGQILGIFRECGISARRIRLGGGGAKSAPWRQMQADVYGCEVSLPNTEEGPALGGALLAGVAAGAWKTVEEACDAVIRDGEVREPDAGAVARYAAIGETYARVYPALRESFASLSRFGSE